MFVSIICKKQHVFQRYDLYGLPSMPMRFEHSLVKSADLESTLFLESTWREINENKNLSNTEIHIQESIWEIFATERSYMKGLKLKICFLKKTKKDLTRVSQGQ